MWKNPTRIPFLAMAPTVCARRPRQEACQPIATSQRVRLVGPHAGAALTQERG